MKRLTTRAWLIRAWLFYASCVIVAIVGPIITLRILSLEHILSLGQSPFFPYVLSIVLMLLLVHVLVVSLFVRFIQRAILNPLAAMSRASRQIAGGDLHFSLSSSSIQEVAEVIATFSTMGEAMRDSLARQKALEQERRFFISAIAHDLRTPLFSLRGYLEGIEKGVAHTPEMISQYVGVCCEKAEVIQQLVTDLFLYTQLEYLERLPQCEATNMSEFLHKIVQARFSQAEDRGIMLQEKSPSKPCVLAVDKQLIQRVIENLLDNALRYTPPGGCISVNWDQTQDHFVFTVADTGAGIAPHDLPHVFEPLYRGETSRNRQTGGVGLGLAIAQRIMLAHGGVLSAMNRDTGGAAFHGFLPYLPDVPPEQPADALSAFFTEAYSTEQSRQGK